MAKPLSSLAGLFFSAALLSPANALILGDADTAGHASPATIAPAFAADTTAAFPFWNNVGTIGMGTGTYIGDGWVLTAAHVGCFPFVAADGTVWQPLHASYRVLRAADGSPVDVAMFQLADRPNLPAIPLAKAALDAAAPTIVVGNGYTQDDKGEPLLLNGREVGTLGFHTRPVRAKNWGRLYTNGGVEEKRLAGERGTSTPVFTARFERKAHSAQATDGDSGSPVFAFNRSTSQWELVGCVAAVSHKSRYVPFGSTTFLAALHCLDLGVAAPVAALPTTPGKS